MNRSTWADVANALLYAILAGGLLAALQTMGVAE